MDETTRGILSSLVSVASTKALSHLEKHPSVAEQTLSSALMGVQESSNRLAASGPVWAALIAGEVLANVVVLAKLCIEKGAETDDVDG